MSARNESSIHEHRPLIFDASLTLLDRQVLDRDDEPVCTVDDLELSGDLHDGVDFPVGGPRPRITAILAGPVLVTRVFGGRPPRHLWERIDWGEVDHVGVMVKLRLAAEALNVGWTEAWLRERVVARIPGGRHESE
jgi:hypothetical protein